MAEDAFSERTYIAISELDGTRRSFSAEIETIDISGGDKDFDTIANVGGGRIKKFLPQTDIEVTMEGYAVEMGTASGTTGTGFYDLLHSADTTQPISISNDHTRTNYELILLATNKPSVSDAAEAIANDYEAERWKFQGGHFVNLTASFTDKIWKFTLKYKVPPFTKSAASTVTYESTDGTADLPIVTAYSSS